MDDRLLWADQHLVRLVRSEVSLIGTVDANYFAPVVLISVSAGIKVRDSRAGLISLGCWILAGLVRKVKAHGTG